MREEIDSIVKREVERVERKVGELENGLKVVKGKSEEIDEIESILSKKHQSLETQLKYQSESLQNQINDLLKTLTESNQNKDLPDFSQFITSEDFQESIISLQKQIQAQNEILEPQIDELTSDLQETKSHSQKTAASQSLLASKLEDLEALFKSLDQNQQKSS